jgi:two-component system chemotaxis response regulator CheB
MPTIRVLIVDDAVAARRWLTAALQAMPDVEVVGTAANGRIGLTKIERLDPDLVLLDVEMPEMDGLEALRAIREQRQELPVIMFSAHTERGAVATLDALTLGASDYVTKPSSLAEGAAEPEVVAELARKVRAVAGRRGVAAEPSAELPRRTVKATRSGARPRVVAIGASTGGPAALAAVLECLPAGFPLPVLVVQHMPALFTGLLATRLDARCRLPVAEAADGCAVRPGTVVLARGDVHLVVARRNREVTVVDDHRPPRQSCRPSLDVLVESIVETYGGEALAVVLTGMGKDGLSGCRRLKEHGGTVLAQDAETSVVWGMPGYVAREGLADAVLPLAEIGPAVVRRGRHRDWRVTTTAGGST